MPGLRTMLNKTTRLEEAESGSSQAEVKQLIVGMLIAWCSHIVMVMYDSINPSLLTPEEGCYRHIYVAITTWPLCIFIMLASSGDKPPETLRPYIAPAFAY